MSTCIVTCGPASTRIDEVRRITNFSSGELGTLLTEALRVAGHEVICLRGEGATFRPPVGAEVESFFTNADLLTLLQKMEAQYIFHAAALTDFEVASLCDSDGNPLQEKKIPSSTTELNIRLRPGTKIITQLRPLFPNAQITGWKYELSGTGEEALQKARLQLQTCGTDACVLNGAAFGAGFAYLTTDERKDFPTKASLVRFLAQKVAR